MINMKKFIKTPFLLVALFVMLLAQSCVETDDLVTPNVASPVLILLDGSSFSSTSSVSVNSMTYELDKTNILDHTLGIDSIPVSNLNLEVYIETTTKVASLTTDTNGSADLEITWGELGIDEPTSGTQVRLEFAGSYKDIAFRKYHTVTVE